jgi:hypothetical protein
VELTLLVRHFDKAFFPLNDQRTSTFRGQLIRLDRTVKLCARLRALRLQALCLVFPVKSKREARFSILQPFVVPALHLPALEDLHVAFDDGEVGAQVRTIGQWGLLCQAFSDFDNLRINPLNPEISIVYDDANRNSN